MAIFETKKPQDNTNKKLRESLPIPTKEPKTFRKKFITMLLNQRKEEEKRTKMFANTSSMMKKVESSNVQDMKIK